MCLSADGRLALFFHKDKYKLWDLAGERCLHTWERRGGISRLGSSQDLQIALSNNGDGFLRLWAIGRDLPSYAVNRGLIDLSADGRYALTSGVGDTAKLWETASGRCLRTFEGLEYLEQLCLSADTRYALTLTRGTVKVWATDSGSCVQTFEASAHRFALTADGRYLVTTTRGSPVGRLTIWELDWDLEDRAPADWDEGARPHLLMFLSAHTPYAAELPQSREPTEEEIRLALTRRGRPAWTESDFRDLLYTLGCAGYGWLRPEGVRRELESMARTWQGPPPLARTTVTAAEKKDEPKRSWLGRMMGRRKT
jgi:WD40 repeat protein